MAVELTAAVCVPLSLLVPLLKRPCRSSVMDVSTSKLKDLYLNKTYSQYSINLLRRFFITFRK